MSFIPATLEPLRRLARLGPLPRIKALHLPPQPAADAARAEARGEFCALELDDGTLGLAYVLLGDTCAALHAGPWRRSLPGQDALQLADSLPECHDAATRVLAWAALNALTRHLFDRAGYRAPTSRDSFGQLVIRPGERIGMVGLFGPLIERLRAQGADLTVIELRAELVRSEPGLRVTLDPAELRGCTQILCTSTVLLNDSLAPLLPHCADARHLAMIGPGAGCLPDALFERGITLLGGTWIEDGPACISAIERGESLNRATRKVVMTREDYPGMVQLLARIAPMAGS
ncbi:MAG: hypothetical protein RJA44_367 [Pseudomonadota bacterium]